MPLDETVEYSDLIKMQDVMATEFMSTFESVAKDTVLKAAESKLSVSGKNIAVSIIKVPESGEKNSFVVRVFNASGEDTEGYIKTIKDIKKAELINLNEEPECEVTADKNRVEFQLSPWKIKTFKIYYRN